MADASRYRLLVLFLVGLVVMALGQQQELNVGAATVAPQRPAATSAAQPAAQSQPAAPKLPQSYWQWKGQAGTNPSYSVIIPSHNTAPYITAALQSVANSISYFNKHGGRAFHAEVVVVDDASTDNTVARVMAFMEQQRRLNDTNTTWKLVSMQQNVLGGAARNFGVRESSGDILLYLDSDDLYLERHIAVCVASLIRAPQLAMIQTKAKIDIDPIHPRWKEKVEGTIPHTRALWRKAHDFVEGYPEQGVFTRHQDVGYLLAFAASNAPMAVVSEETVVYKRYPGNSLDQQAAKFAMDPKVAPKSPEEQTEEYPVRLTILNMHTEHIRNKVLKLSKGEATENNPLWAIYQHSADQLLPKRYEDKLDIKKIRFRRLVETAEALTFSGKQNEAKEVFGIIHKFVYNTTMEAGRVQEPIHFVHSV